MSIQFEDLIIMLPVVLLLSFVLYLPVYLTKKKELGKRPFIRHLANYAFIAIVLTIIYVTLGTNINISSERHFPNLIPFVNFKSSYEINVSETLKQLQINFNMLIPLGFILPVVFISLRKWWKTIICIVGFIVCTEALQYFVGRFADIDDLIINTFGGYIGYNIFALLNKYLHDKVFWEKLTNAATSSSNFPTCQES